MAVIRVRRPQRTLDTAATKREGKSCIGTLSAFCDAVVQGWGA